MRVNILAISWPCGLQVKALDTPRRVFIRTRGSCATLKPSRSCWAEWQCAVFDRASCLLTATMPSWPGGPKLRRRSLPA
eukprot:10028360-Alexandrium_andersonii.AAC.2